MATAAIDVAYIAASYSIPEPTLQTLLDAPTVELVQQLLSQIETKAKEFDELKAEKLRSDVELENAVRTGDNRVRALKASVDKGLKDVEELRKKLNEEGMFNWPWTRPSLTDKLSRKCTLLTRVRTAESQVVFIEFFE